MTVDPLSFLDSPVAADPSDPLSFLDGLGTAPNTSSVVPAALAMQRRGGVELAAGPNLAKSSGSFLLEGVKDVAVSTVTGIPGVALLALDSPFMIARFIAEKVVGENLGVTRMAERDPLLKASSYLLDIAAASYEDVVDSQADWAVATSRATGLPLEATATASTLGFGTLNAISPWKYAKVVLGMTAGAGALVYGGSKLLRKGASAASGKVASLRGVNDIAREAAKIGDVVDPMRSFSKIDDVSEAVSSRALAGDMGSQAEDLASRARQQVATEAQFPFAPRSITQQSVPRELLDAARAESRASNLFPNLPGGGAASRGLDTQAALLISESKTAQVKAAKVAEDSTDPLFRRLFERIRDGHIERGMSVKDAEKAGRLEFTMLPESVPEIRRPTNLLELKEVALNLGRRYLYRRPYAYAQIGDRSKVLRSVLESGDKVADEALFKDMTFFIQKTGNPTVNKIDTITDVSNRMLAHPNGREAMALADNIRPWLDQLFKEMAELNIQVNDTALGYIDNWLHQAWKPVQEGGVLGFGSTRGVLGSGLFRSRDKARQQLTRIKGRFEEARTLPSFEVGINAGFEPRTLDAVNVLELAERQYGETMATKKLLADIGEIGALPDGTQAYLRIKDGKFPKGVESSAYERADIPYLTRFVKGEGDMYVHKEVYKPLRNIIEGLAGDDGNFLDDLSLLNKRANFTFTMFHAFSLSENAILALGLGKGVKTLLSVAKAGGGIPFADKLGGPKALDHLFTTGSMRESQLRALKYLVKLEAPETDLMRPLWERAAKEAAESVGGKGGKVISGLAWAQKNFDTALWERMHTPLKTKVFEELYATMLRAKAGGKVGFKNGGIAAHFKGKALQDLSDDEIGYRVGAFVNDEFGGQQWGILQGKLMQALARPKMLKQLRRFFISPDWNISSFRANLSVLSLFGGDPVRGVLGARHWRNVFLGTAMSAHGMNFMLTKAFEGEGRFAFDNDPGKDGMIGFMPKHIATGFKDDDGRRIYLRVGKQLQEVGGFLDNQMEFMGRKMTPWAGVLVDTLSDEPSHFSNLGKALQQAREEGIELDGADYVLLYGKDFAEAFMPFSATANPLRNDPLPLDEALFNFAGMGDAPEFLQRGSDLLIPLPQSRGGSRGDLQRRMTKAIKSNDWEGHKRIIDSLINNGYTPAQITQIVNTSRTLAMKQLGGNN